MDDFPARGADERPLAVILMGVSGSGKTVVGEALAARLGVPFLDGDGFHPASNVAKMSSGIPLTDADRWPWLDAIGGGIAGTPGGVVVACSALRRVYRERLEAAAPSRRVVFVLLDGSREILEGRLSHRKGHFMPKSLLDSQLATLERPGADEPAFRVDVTPPVDAVVDAILAQLRTRWIAAGRG
jgi:gluconokinase